MDLADRLPGGERRVVTGQFNLPRVIPHVIRHLDNGGLVVIDSGAFGAFRADRTLDFEAEVFPIYEMILSGTSRPDLLTLTAPDVVGNPSATLALQLSHMDRLRRWATSGAHVIIPIQKGGDAVAHYQVIADAFGTLGFTVGIPSNAKAWTLADLLPFIREARPARIHLLGLSAARRVKSWVFRIQEISPGTSVQCDACQIIAHAGQGKRLTDRCHSRMDAALTQAALTGSPLAEDDIEALPTMEMFRHLLWDEPNLLTPALTLLLAQLLHTPEWEEQLTAAIPFGLHDAFGRMDPDEEWLHERLMVAAPMLYTEWLRTILSGPIRAYELSRLTVA